MDEWLRQAAAPGEVVSWSSGGPQLRKAPFTIEGRVLVIDEPEVHLHPLAQSQVADWLVEMSQRATQVITASHSPQILNAYSPLVHLVG